MSVKARAFAIAAHSAIGQKRKFTGEPYYNHPLRVHDILLEYYPDASLHMREAALLHDVLEDTSVTWELLLKEFGPVVTDMVVNLSNQKTLGASREDNKKAGRVRLASASIDVKCIKLADRLDNFSDICMQEKSFALQYAKETRLLLDESLCDKSNGVMTRKKINLTTMWHNLSDLVDDSINEHS